MVKSLLEICESFDYYLNVNESCLCYCSDSELFLSINFSFCINFFILLKMVSKKNYIKKKFFCLILCIFV